MEYAENEWLSWKVTLGNLMVCHLLPNGTKRWVPAGLASARQLLDMAELFEHRQVGSGPSLTVRRAACQVMLRNAHRFMEKHARRP